MIFFKMTSHHLFWAVLMSLPLFAVATLNEEEALRMWRLNSLSYCSQETMDV